MTKTIIADSPEVNSPRLSRFSVNSSEQTKQLRMTLMTSSPW